MQLHVRRWPGDGARVLLLHGLSSSSEGWWRLGPELSRLGFQVTAPDLRGHGATGAAAEYAVAEYRDDVLALGGGWDVVVGHSLGGLVTAACQDANPEFASALILVDPALRVVASQDLLSALLGEFETATPGTLRAAQPRWAEGDVAAKVAALAAVAPGVVDQTFGALADADGWEAVARFTVPTLIIGADTRGGGALVSELDGRRAERNHMVRYKMIDGADHSPHRDSYEAFFTLVRDFLDERGLVGLRY